MMRMNATTSIATTAPSNDTTKQDQSNASSLLSGALNELIADAVFQSLERHLLPLLQALPVLGAGEPTQLQQRLLQHYLPAADLVELYGQRNVFSLERIEPPSRRQRMLEVLEQCQEDPEMAASMVLEESSGKNDWMDAITTEESNPDDENALNLVQTLRKSDIPTAKDVQSAEEDMQTLNLQLQQLKQQHETLSKDLDVLKSLNENQRSHAAVSKAGHAIPDQVQERIAVAQALRECQNDSATLQQRMAAMERERSGQSMDAIVVPVQPVKAAPAATLMERFEQDFQQLGGGAISAQSLASLTEMLKK